MAGHVDLVAVVATLFICNDADDDHVIAAAVTARAELIVTGDRKHPLPIGTHQGIAIVTAREVVERIEARGQT
nr:PIN domain-containing protein [Roseateles sp. SL47]